MPGPKRAFAKSRSEQLSGARAKRAKQNENGCSTKPVKATADPSGSASRRKIETMGAAENIGAGDEQCWAIAHVFQLTRLLLDLSCPHCEETGLSVTICDKQNAGFASQLCLHCDGCG